MDQKSKDKDKKLNQEISQDIVLRVNQQLTSLAPKTYQPITKHYTQDVSTWGFIPDLRKFSYQEITLPKGCEFPVYYESNPDKYNNCKVTVHCNPRLIFRSDTNPNEYNFLTKYTETIEHQLNTHYSGVLQQIAISAKELTGQIERGELEVVRLTDLNSSLSDNIIRKEQDISNLEQEKALSIIQINNLQQHLLSKKDESESLLTQIDDLTQLNNQNIQEKQLLENSYQEPRRGDP